ncbi:2-amino-4-hydroxy-6-hydroxymethyldihydropteridine diphosphokinase [Variovorax sp. SG517]|uniref:2-amino-4-hydroxy-6- hydroxymethyldihydropteridine diphosphokinase n=1 Tax=unclassified Variovorax TaxID=663243 RepID=UPI00159D4555|nr:2-amino-4-hydroxy-6-hydroxymethyldihydropteridine diphosphokinase [Variovorax sp. SG517]
MSTPDRPKDGKPGPKAKAVPPRAGGGAKPPSAGAKSGPPARRAPTRTPTRAPSRSPRGPREDYPTVQAFIAIGANLGDAEASVKAAMADIGALQRTVVTARSSLYRSEPVDAEGPDFINAVVAVRTGLDAEQLLVALQRLETLAGRERPFPNAPRTLDLDLLMHGNSVIDTPTLTLPHPRMRERAFVLKPLAEIAPDKVPRAALARVTGQVVKRIL